jgi:hypothetical protein
MTTTMRPEAGEYAPSFAGYVARVAEDEDVVAVLATQLDQALALLGRIPEARGDYRYAPGKWSVKEIVGHLSDTERVFAYRALRIGRGDSTPLASFEDQAYVGASRAGDRALADLAAEWADVRRATLALFRSLPAEAWQSRGTASDQPISVRALAYIIAGHVRHHLQVLEERYTE